MPRNVMDYAIVPSLASEMLRNFTDCVLTLLFNSRHVAKLHGLPNDGCQVPRSGQGRETRLKEIFDSIPTLDELHALGGEGLKADIILEDLEKDKKLYMLKKLIMALVRGLNSNPAAIIKKIVGLVSDFYKRPNVESPAKAALDESSHMFENRGVQMLGQIKHGSCRPRAILFKVLADTIGLESRLMVAQRHILAGLASVVGDLSAPYEKACHVHESPIVNWLWAVGCHSFGPFSNTSHISQMLLDVALMNALSICQNGFYLPREYSQIVLVSSYANFSNRIYI
ncbi:hypothetical protein JHK82_024752 [Glycine max]|uniref:EDR1/CTR1/ARMC3-like peptidase-like domain-containing protein n=1 Tax=Glycine max TaxID=3847 RepID=K7LD86_SOYBN|nr:hypothetical protein JHK86_024870 [Glycine max]KAG5133564.1 hypothetical protein JHK82_024752 [Glycine max]KAH1042540.1 hypothetical protein GYH30_024714 [Glycine max]KAH1233109.1 hypothetical protein GmHk_09G025629 [Glycine max]